MKENSSRALCQLNIVDVCVCECVSQHLSIVEKQTHGAIL